MIHMGGGGGVGTEIEPGPAMPHSRPAHCYPIYAAPSEIPCNLLSYAALKNILTKSCQRYTEQVYELLSMRKHAFLSHKDGYYKKHKIAHLSLEHMLTRAIPTTLRVKSLSSILTK